MLIYVLCFEEHMNKYDFKKYIYTSIRLYTYTGISTYKSKVSFRGFIILPSQSFCELIQSLHFFMNTKSGFRKYDVSKFARKLGRCDSVEISFEIFFENNAHSIAKLDLSFELINKYR